MKKQFLRRALLTLVGGVILSTSAWADGTTTTIGAVQNGWNAANSYTSPYTIGKNQTLKLNFKVNETRGNYIADGWVTVLCKTNTISYNSDMYLFLRTDCYGVNSWDWNNKTTNNSGWFICNQNNFYWPSDDTSTEVDEALTNFQAYISGSTVDLTIRRYGTEVFVITDVTTANSVKYRHYFVMKCGNEDEDIYGFLAADYANITINSSEISSSEVPSQTGTLIGSLNHGVAGIKENPFMSFPLAANETITLHFKNYTNRVFIWNNFVIEITDNTHFVDLRGDGAGWQWAADWGTYTTWWDSNNLTKTNYPATDYDYMDAMDGADVVATVSRENEKFTITAKITPLSGNEFTEVYTFSDANLTSQAVTVNLLCEGAHLDLLPVTATITEYNWATFASDYALDFSKATEGLKAYMVTGHNDNAIIKTPVAGTVPAGTGLLLYAETPGDYNIPIVETSTTSTTGNHLVAGTGEAVAKETGKTKYALGVNSANKAAFMIINDYAPVMAKNKAYLQFDEVISAPFLSFEGDGETTGIANVNVNANSNSNSSWYDLSGRRVANPTNGLYIVNGKKVIIK